MSKTSEAVRKAAIDTIKKMAIIADREGLLVNEKEWNDNVIAELLSYRTVILDEVIEAVAEAEANGILPHDVYDTLKKLKGK